MRKQRRLCGKTGAIQTAVSNVGRAGRPNECWASNFALRDLIQECLGFPQISCIDALGEPTVDRCEQLARLRPPSLLSPQPCQARRSSQLIGFCLLLPGDRERLMEIYLTLIDLVGTQ